jgi:hypothetical protein
MTEEQFKSKWWANMIAKHGSEAAVRAFMAESSKKSKRNTGGTGGFAALAKTDPERHKQLSAEGGKHGTSNTGIDPIDQPDSTGLSDTVSDQS